MSQVSHKMSLVLVFFTISQVGAMVDQPSDPKQPPPIGTGLTPIPVPGKPTSPDIVPQGRRIKLTIPTKFFIQSLEFYKDATSTTATKYIPLYLRLRPEDRIVRTESDEQKTLETSLYDCNTLKITITTGKGGGITNRSIILRKNITDKTDYSIDINEIKNAKQENIKAVREQIKALKKASAKKIAPELASLKKELGKTKKQQDALNKQVSDLTKTMEGTQLKIDEFLKKNENTDSTKAYNEILSLEGKFKALQSVEL